MANPRRGLVYRPGSLGDTLVSLPAIAEIRRRYPDHRLTLLTENPVAGSARVSPWAILRDTGWFEDVCFYTVKPVSLGDRLRNVGLALRLRRTRFDDIFSLAPPRTTRQLRVDSCIFRGVVGADRYHAATRAAWPPSAVDPEHRQHEGLRLLRIVDPVGSDQALSSFRLAVPDADLAVGRDLLQGLGVRPDQMLVGVGPGSARSTTAWPPERFAALGRALLDQFRNVVLLAIGGSSERRLCDELCEVWGSRSHNLAGRLSVFGSASVLSHCATFIGNDSGPTHLAAMVGTPCVAIFSARNAPGQWQPLGRQHVVLEERPECAGCMLDDCVHEAKKCLTRIETGRVVREAISLIESRRACLAQ
jgi:ADP-heptose:LPS heptosyltransferase